FIPTPPPPISTLFPYTTLFRSLLLRSRMIPRALSGLGIFASVLVTLLGFANLIVPRYSGTLSPGWIAILMAEVLTGLWLLIRGVDRKSTRLNSSHRTISYAVFC